MPSLNYVRVQEYLSRLVPRREPEMVMMERYAARTGFPIIGPAAGYYCYQLARQIGAKTVFELGSGYGYSTAWFAKAVKENGGGLVHHTVWDEKLSDKARGHLSRLGYGSVVRYHVEEALGCLQQQPGEFDLIFSDIDKEAYPESLPIVKRKLRIGGVLIVDNLLWSGRIFDRRDRSADTRGVRDLTKAIASDPDWIATIVPVRDGLLTALLQSK